MNKRLFLATLFATAVQACDREMPHETENVADTPLSSYESMLEEIKMKEQEVEELYQTIRDLQTEWAPIRAEFNVTPITAPNAAFLSVKHNTYARRIETLYKNISSLKNQIGQLKLHAEMTRLSLANGPSINSNSPHSQTPQTIRKSEEGIKSPILPSLRRGIQSLTNMRSKTPQPKRHAIIAATTFSAPSSPNNHIRDRAPTPLRKRFDSLVNKPKRTESPQPLTIRRQDDEDINKN